MASDHSTRHTPPRRRLNWPNVSRSTTPPNTDPGSTSPRSNFPCCPGNASTAGSPTSTPSTPNSPPGNTRPTPTNARSIGNSQPPTHASNSATYTQTIRSDELLGVGTGSLVSYLPPYRGWLLDGLRPVRHRRWEWLKRGLSCPKLVCPPHRSIGTRILEEK